MNINKMNFSGSFYPESENDLKKYFEYFNKNKKNIVLNLKPRAIIVPHAGYIYSGSVANLAYNLTKDVKPKRVIVIGPSHRYYLEGASISLYDSYETPLGNLEIDLSYANFLKENYSWLIFNDDVHMEHSTETQIPFIKNYYESKVIEIIYGEIDYMSLSTLVVELLKDDENFVVISTDLSHFHNLNEANIIDKKTIDAIEKKDIDLLDDACEACGIVGVKAIIEASNILNFKSQFLDYKTSFENTNDDTSVVGYTSFVIGE